MPRRVRLSPTQFSTARRCLRLYWRLYCNGERDSIPQTPAQRRGSELHAQLESYYKGEIELGQVDKALRPAIKGGALPPRGIFRELVEAGRAGTEVSVEIDRGFASHSAGKVDMWILHSTPVLEVLDLKTTSDLKWALSAEELRQNPQVCLYAAALAVHLRTPRSYRVRLVHVTVERSTGRWQRVEADVDVGDCFDVFERDRAFAPTIRDLWAADHKSWRDVPPVENAPDNPACRMYSGCAFLHQCSAGGRSILRTMGEKMNLPTPSGVLDKAEVESVFSQLHSQDAAMLLAMAGVRDPWQICSHAQGALILSTARGAVGSISPEDYAALLAQAPPEIAAQAPPASASPGARRQGEAFLRGVLGAGQAINPPDARPDGPIPPPDPATALLTTIDGIGQTGADRVVEVARKLGCLIDDKPTIAQTLAAMHAGLDLRKIKGFSAAKVERVTAFSQGELPRPIAEPAPVPESRPAVPAPAPSPPVPAEDAGPPGPPTPGEFADQLRDHVIRSLPARERGVALIVVSALQNVAQALNAAANEIEIEFLK